MDQINFIFSNQRRCSLTPSNYIKEFSIIFILSYCWIVGLLLLAYEIDSQKVSIFHFIAKSIQLFGEEFLNIIIYCMQRQTKIEASPNTTLKTQQETQFLTQITSLLRQPLKRFNRSNSRSRSKSRQDIQPELSPRFFVKNICGRTAENKEKGQISSSKFSRVLQRNGKRQGTPVKSRKTPHQDEIKQQCFEHKLQEQIQWIKLQRRCQLSQAQSLQLAKINKELQQRLNELQSQLADTIHQKLFFQEKIKYYQQKEKKDPRDRNNNLLKLKKEIAKQKEIDGAPPLEILNQKLEIAYNQINSLRESLNRSQKLRKQAQAYAQRHKNERQIFLEDLVQQLKLDISQKDQIIDKIKIQLNILLIRQAKKQDLAEKQKNQELQTLTKKYGSILKKYHDVTQQLKAYKIKQQRTGSIFNTPKRTVQNSLSLSP